MVLPVDVLLGGSRFERFSIDISPPSEDVAFDSFERVDPPLGIDQLGTATVHVFAVANQLADKLCAIHERHGSHFSSRWRDLADVAMIAQQIEGIEFRQVQSAVNSEAARRTSTLVEGLPNRLTLAPQQRDAWRIAWGSGGRTVPLDFETALASARAFADPVLGGTGRGMWSPSRASWS